ncbi:hypothetical protein HH310_25620 [Actinoplanes sp. TBRC 11911]|uniref:hypothetical protein n=1 Tax=Actinoplanes sp. TBRC 11911 TaxID=2729386 RepID=UPI00145CCAA3|nr:hypothetical protein [Actinoplanes sp. TBRC 11911]NMO54549.1 hypothetical protein [Actinoplanes sp. TBRC 11911]
MGSPPRPSRSTILRGRFVDRLVSVNAAHAGHAADLIRTKDDVCEHALVLFSANPAVDRSHETSIATRLSLSDTENADIVDWLGDLTRVVEQKVAEPVVLGRRWDPRTPFTGLVSRTEELTSDMVYMGVGVSTLDTPEQSWRQMKRGVERYSGLRMRGQGYLLLDDDTTVHLIRAPQTGPQTGRHQITANQPIETQYGHWTRQHDMIRYADERTARIWDRLQRLHRLLQAATAR